MDHELTREQLIELLRDARAVSAQRLQGLDAWRETAMQALERCEAWKRLAMARRRVTLAERALGRVIAADAEHAEYRSAMVALGDAGVALEKLGIDPATGLPLERCQDSAACPDAALHGAPEATSTRKALDALREGAAAARDAAYGVRRVPYSPEAATEVRAQGEASPARDVEWYQVRGGVRMRREGHCWTVTSIPAGARLLVNGEPRELPADVGQDDRLQVEQQVPVPAH